MPTRVHCLAHCDSRFFHPFAIIPFVIEIPNYRCKCIFHNKSDQLFSNTCLIIFSLCAPFRHLYKPSRYQRIPSTWSRCFPESRNKISYNRYRMVDLNGKIHLLLHHLPQ
jgi:hypothetical protein